MSTTAPATPLKREPHGSASGIFLIVATVLCFSCMDASAKWLGTRVPPLELIAVRYGLAFLLSAVFLNPWTRPGVLRSRNLRLQCIRGLLVVASTVTGWTAVRFMPLTKLTSITFAAPLLVALLAGPMLGERIGPRRLVAVCVGFIGVLVVTRPFGGGLNWAAGLAFVAACCNAMYSILARRLAAVDPAETTLLYTGLMGVLVLTPMLPFVWTPPPALSVWLVMLLLGALGALSHWLLILAHRCAPASMLAPFYYTQILGAVGLGFIVFGDLPDRWTITGSSIVIVSGLYLFYRERVRQKAVPSADVAG